ncbi:hypothetical protein MPSEU_001041300 [Mayamaea pseudoterrestris]|nr:hypothetical protein MPSEU_001041300 [Mayamaea pseudoterrestris]
MNDRSVFMSYKSSKTVAAETVYQFLHGALYGGVWGLVTPFPAPGSAAALKEAATGVFRPVPPFGSVSTAPSNAIFFGSVLAIQRFSAKSLELMRQTEDVYNDLFGFVMIYPYYTSILNHSERRLIRHNRAIGGAVLLAVIYANVLA